MKTFHWLKIGDIDVYDHTGSPATTKITGGRVWLYTDQEKPLRVTAFTEVLFINQQKGHVDRTEDVNAWLQRNYSYIHRQFYEAVTKLIAHYVQHGKVASVRIDLREEVTLVG